MKKLTTDFCGVTFPTPLVLASGIVASPEGLLACARERGIGGITSKSVSIEPRAGHPTPVVVPYSSGFINSVGLKNPGLKQAVQDIKKMKLKSKVPVIASIVAFQLSEFYPLAHEIAKAKPDLIEVNLSCPNVDDEGGKPYATDALLSALAIQEVKQAVKTIPIVAKLSPNVIDIKEIARAVVDAGADAISAINTVGPGLLIDLKTRKPKLGHGVGGISGASIKPLALRIVRDIATSVSVPIIGMGGVRSGLDALEMIAVGATLVGIGSAMYGVGNPIFGKVYDEMIEGLETHGISDVKKLRHSVV